jgi:Spy/CpxP family protein refolding chaperone
MKNRNAVIAVVAVAAAALVAGSAAIADGHGPHGRAGEGMFGIAGGPGMHGPGGGLGIPLHRLDVTDEQREAIRAIVEAEQPAVQALRDKVRDSQQAFMEAHPPTEFDEAAIRAHHAEQAPLLADLAVAEARVRAKALAVLTPEQLAELATMRSQMREHMAERRGMRRAL